MEAHGGYLFRSSPNDVVPERLVQLAREALAQDGVPTDDCAVQLSMLPSLSIVRVAFDASFTYGVRGARWYEEHHALARLLSAERKVTVHAYVFDPNEFELVTTYADGHSVGGEKVIYDELELDEEELEDEDAYERQKDRWPLGHLARVFGTSRNELLRLPRSPTLLVDLTGPRADASVAQLLTQRIA